MRSSPKIRRRCNEREDTMPHATTDDGVRLYYEETGSGTPVIFVHEFAGDYRSWEPQMRHFGQRYRAITYNARGYPPSDVPEDVAKYSQARAADDIARGAGSPEDRQGACRRPVDGRLRHAAFRLPPSRRARCRCVVAGCGYGAEHGPDASKFRAEAETIAGVHRSTRAWRCSPTKYAYGPTRVQFENKDPRGFAEFKQQLARALRAGRAQHAARRAAASGRRCTTWSIR